MTCKQHNIPLRGLTSFILFCGCDSIDSNARQVLGKISLPEGFSVEFYASDVSDVRQMVFSDGDLFPEEYKNEIFIAGHGNWNRSDKIRYRITWVSLRNDEPVSYELFADGWLLDNDAVWGRPVDLLQLSDGSLLISDDHRGINIIYHITYNP